VPAGGRRKTMRAFSKSVLALITALTMGVTAARSDEPIVPEGTTVQLLLLRQKSVQQELKLTPAVIQKALDFTSKENEEYGKALKLKGKEHDKLIEDLEKANKKFLDENLSAEQRKRLDQITLQVTGLHQLNRPEVARALKLTEAQQKKFAEMRKAADKEMEEILSEKKIATINEKLTKLRARIDKEIEDALTDDQKKAVSEQIGERFKGELLIEAPDPEKDKP
jgi:hypothetical protein